MHRNARSLSELPHAAMISGYEMSWEWLCKQVHETNAKVRSVCSHVYIRSNRDTCSVNGAVNW
jgi:hypothetical protein